MPETQEKKPKITLMGEEIPWDDVPEPTAASLEDYFKPVKISPNAINQVSRIVPQKHWVQEGMGLHMWIQKRADYVFGKLKADETAGILRSLKYTFEYTADGPELKDVRLIA